MSNVKSPIRIAITGAAGQISYSLLFRIANGDIFGIHQPVILQLLELESALPGLQGTVMELQDCAFPLLHALMTTHDPLQAFDQVDVAILIGAKARTKGMERKDLLAANANIFHKQGQAIAAAAKASVKILVVGNPANTNALILTHSSKLNPRNITAMMRLDHNRAVGQLAVKLECNSSAIDNVIVWGNHSNTQYPDIAAATMYNKSVSGLLDAEWVTNTFIPTVQQRGSEIIAARGFSSAASAANAIIGHLRDWLVGSNNKIVSMGVASDGSYGIAPGVVFGYPCICNNGEYRIATDIDINLQARKLLDLSYDELISESQSVGTYL